MLSRGGGGRFQVSLIRLGLSADFWFRYAPIATPPPMLVSSVDYLFWVVVTSACLQDLGGAQAEVVEVKKVTIPA